MKHNITVGQQVFVVSARYHQRDAVKAEYKVVTRVGNKYFYTGEGWDETKFSLETLVEVKDGSYCDCVYITEKEYNGRVVLQVAWDDFRAAYNKCQYARPKHLTAEQLLGIVEILKGQDK